MDAICRVQQLHFVYCNSPQIWDDEETKKKINPAHGTELNGTISAAVLNIPG